MTASGFDATLAAAREGAPWAWEALYRDLGPRVLAYLRARRVPEPEDVLGEIFVSVVRDLSRFSGAEDDFRAWVFTIAHHRLVDDLRMRRRRVFLVAEPVAEVATGLQGGDVEAEAIDRLTGGEVARILDELTPEQRDVLLMRIFGDLSLQEVADALGKPLGAVKSLQHRAVRAVKRNMS